MSKKKRAVFIVVWVALMVVVLVAALVVGGSGESESIKVVMRDAVLHGTNKVSLFGIKDVNPAYISSLAVCGVLLIAAAIIRIFVIPRFKMVPGKFQMILEQLVGFFDNLAKTSSPHRNTFLGAYVFSAGVYIFVGTLFELFGIQAPTTVGGTISLPAPLSGYQRGDHAGLSVLSGDPQRRYRRREDQGRGTHPQGILAAHLDELPSFRRAAQRSAGNGACLLQHQPELCSPGIRGNHVHAAACAYPGVCTHHADGDVLRRGIRAAAQVSEKARFQINR